MGKVVRRMSRAQHKLEEAVAGRIPVEFHSQEPASKVEHDQQFQLHSPSHDTSAASDFGGLVHHQPVAIFRPSSAAEIARLASAAAAAKVPLAARGNGHSIHGQAQAQAGVVVDMSAMPRDVVVVAAPPGGGPAYVDAGGGELWIDVLKECLRHGVAPKSWTDYLYLTVGGTLSNAGVSGQAFRHGPQISNVLQLEVVTGKGEIVTCSAKKKSDLFYAVLGGLGQFGIITRARIELEKAPRRAHYVRLLYADFERFRHDIEWLISLPDNNTHSINYVEGSVIPNTDDPSQGWPCVPFPGQHLDPSLVPDSSIAPVLYCIEIAKFYDDPCVFDQQAFSTLLASLSHLPSLVFSVDWSYFDFLNRVKAAEDAMRKNGVWDVPHPWLILFIPRSKFPKFNELVFQRLLTKGVNGPMLAYPLNRSKWETRSSVVIPDESVFYMVGLLRYVIPSGASLEDHLEQNAEILRLCDASGLNVKQYFPHYSNEADWRQHFGDAWTSFLANKLKFDSSAILSPGQKIFSSSRLQAAISK